MHTPIATMQPAACPMTTIDSSMNVLNLQNTTQSPPQEQAQTNPPPNHGSSPTIPEDVATPRPPPADIDIAARARARAQMNHLRALGKTHGHIPNVPIFTAWDNRQSCCNSAVHRSILRGICGNRKDGAYSIVLSGRYEDDEDRGDVVIYTGSGGRKRYTDTCPSKRLRLGPQIYDQSWDVPSNRALVTSYRTSNPVRVVRSWKCPSEYAPIKGYRYDGLYTITKAWTATGLNEKKICRCRLERLPDQPPIPTRPITFSTSKRRRGKGLTSRFACNPPPSTNPYDTANEITSNTRLDHPNPSTTQSEESAGEESKGLLNRQQQPAIPETSAGVNFNTVEMGIDVKHTQPQHPGPRGKVSVDPRALRRYRWDPKKNQVIKLPAPHPTRENPYTTGGEEEEEHRVEDDATLVPSEDGRVGVERVETEYFPDRGSSPRFVTPRTSNDSDLESLEDELD